MKVHFMFSITQGSRASAAIDGTDLISQKYNGKCAAFGHKQRCHIRFYMLSNNRDAGDLRRHCNEQ